jgi:hypothetical protein
VPDTLGETLWSSPTPADQPVVRQRFDQLLAALREQHARLRGLLLALGSGSLDAEVSEADREALILAVRTCLITIDLRRVGYEL